MACSTAERSLSSMARIVSIVASSAANGMLQRLRPQSVLDLPAALSRFLLWTVVRTLAASDLGVFQLCPAASDIRFSHPQLGLVFGDRGLLPGGAPHETAEQSISKSKSPWFTVAPSMNLTVMSAPATWALTSTVEYGSTVPTVCI